MTDWKAEARKWEALAKQHKKELDDLRETAPVKTLEEPAEPDTNVSPVTPAPDIAAFFEANRLPPALAIHHQTLEEAQQYLEQLRAWKTPQFARPSGVVPTAGATI